MGGVSVLQAETNCAKWGTNKLFKRATPSHVMTCLAGRVSASAPRRDGGLPIHKAAEYTKQPEVITVLIDAGADPMARTSKYRSTPLHIASGYNIHKQKRPDLVKVLLANGANPNARDSDGWTPLHSPPWLRWDSPPGIVKALIDAGPDRHLRGKDGARPLDWASSKENRNILAAAGGVRTPKKTGGGTLGAVIAGAIAGTVAVRPVRIWRQP